MEDDAGRKAVAGSQAADAVPQVHAVNSVRALHRPVMHGEHNGFPVLQWYDFGA